MPLSAASHACGEARAPSISSPARTAGLGIVFVRLWIAEVHQQAITKILRNVAVKALGHGAAGGLIGTHYLAVVFRVKLPGERGRVPDHKIAP